MAVELVADLVSIPRDKYEHMLERLDWLECLEAAGVDNWEGYSEAIRIRNESENDCE